MTGPDDAEGWPISKAVGTTLDMWTIYHRPRDMPQFPFVARRCITEANKVTHTDDVRTGATLDEVRSKLPPGLVRLPRHPDDRPHIVEVWL